jgi:hypothetical protein
LGEPLPEAKFGKLKEQGAWTTAWLKKQGVTPNELTDWRRNGIPVHRLNALVQAFWGLLPETERAPSAEAEGAMLESIYALLRLTAEKAQVDPQRIAAIEAARRRVRALGQPQPPLGAPRPKAKPRPRDT